MWRRRWGTSGATAAPRATGAVVRSVADWRAPQQPQRAYIQSAHTRIKERRSGGRERARAGRAADRKTRLSDCLPQSYNPTWMMTEIMNDDDDEEEDCLTVSVCAASLCAFCRCGVALRNSQFRRPPRPKDGATSRSGTRRRRRLVLLTRGSIHRLYSKNRHRATFISGEAKSYRSDSAPVTHVASFREFHRVVS